MTRTIDFIVNDGDIDSNPISRNVEITAENDPPVLSNIAFDAAAVTALESANPGVFFNESTGKFYQVSTTVATSLSNATTLSNNNLLNGVPGQLVNIRSAEENEFIRNLAADGIHAVSYTHLTLPTIYSV